MARSITSKRNGLVVAIPSNDLTGNLIQRFHLKGDNELVFAQKAAATQSVFVGEITATEDVAAVPQNVGDVM